MQKLSDRTAGFTDSVIRRMTRVSKQYDAINLSQGFPDFDPPEEILNRLEQIAKKGPHQYPITWGAQNFREALAAKQTRFMGRKIDPEREIVVTCGSTEAMMTAMMTVANPGDKVVVFSPFYENYGADAILSGAEPIYVSLKPPHFEFDPEELEAAFRTKPKALILCNPSNPCGKVFTAEELALIAELAIKYDVYVITDEVYEHIVYEPHRHIYLSSLPGMAERTISCSSLSKTYSITGWRLGYVIASPEIIERAKKVHDFLTVGAAAPLMEAAVTGLNFPDSYYRELQDHYTHMRNLFLDGLANLDLTFTKPQGAYYVLLDVSEFGVKDDVNFCEWLAREVGVGAVPGSSFFNEEIHNYIRLHFAKKDETLNAALDRLSTLKRKAAGYKAD
ncbi:MAG: aminotransferase class I/II-fold pyridoxal phosphate-dependent enzyme [Clostridiales bacterium]|nr:aminotransferase class I/II-fold pyridoxal phosphate-dependent enzyme [Clostridiales bacterium]